VEPFLQRGFAVARSDFAEKASAMAVAIRDTEALRRYFVRKHGQPAETYAAGYSSGGLLAIAAIESYPEAYDGALPLAGINASVAEIVQRREFDHLVVFDYYFPGKLPPLDDIAAHPALSGEELRTLFEAHPESAESLRRYSGLRSNDELLTQINFYMVSLTDVQRWAGGNPCDNRNTIYSGTRDDNAANDGVKRYSGKASAMEYVLRFYTPTGALTRPVLSLQSTYDPYVPAWVMNAYTRITQQAGTSYLFVQQYVKRDGHFVFTPEETGRAFDQLREWRLKGIRPRPGLLE
jgi:pimeloyl-ACP methyl ester carboxylesterase